MSIPKRDLIATVLVATATLVYVLWLGGFLADLAVGAIAALVLALGFVASASAVVPGFASLLAGSRLYLALASLGGVVALVCGAVTVLQANEQTLALLVIATVGLWAAATARHIAAHRPNVPAAG
jgi:hypothetical protein